MNRLILQTLPLWLLYLALTGEAGPANLAVGAIVAGAVTLLLPRPRVRRSTRSLIAAGPRLGWYLLVLTWDVVLNGLVVAWVVLHPRMPIRPGFVTIRADSPSRWLHAVAAHGINLAPGQMVVRITRPGALRTHCLDAGDPERVRRSQRPRLRLIGRILGEDVR